MCLLFVRVLLRTGIYNSKIGILIFLLIKSLQVLNVFLTLLRSEGLKQVLQKIKMLII